MRRVAGCRMRPQTQPRAARPGFTILEVLIASSIMVVALLGIAAVLPTADMSLHMSGQISKAISLAQEMIEMIKNDPFTGLPSYNNVDTRTPATYPVDDPLTPTPGNPGNFMGGSNVAKWAGDINLFLVTGGGITGGYGTIGVTTVATDGTGNPVLQRVTVTVNWTDSGRPYSVRLATLASAI